MVVIVKQLSKLIPNHGTPRPPKRTYAEISEQLGFSKNIHSRLAKAGFNHPFPNPALTPSKLKWYDQKEVTEWYKKACELLKRTP